MRRHICRILMAVATTVGVVGCSAGRGPFPPAAAPDFNMPARPSVGCLQHRDTKPDLRDLMDPTYRAASNDNFVRAFDPNTATAVLAPDESARNRTFLRGQGPRGLDLTRQPLMVAPAR